MKNIVLLSALILALGHLTSPANGAEILWSQYCQHLGKMKLLVHLDTDPIATTEGERSLDCLVEAMFVKHGQHAW